MTNRDELKLGLDRIEANRGRLDIFRKHWNGEPPASFISKKSREALGSKITRLGVNYPRLVVRSMVDRLRVVGFQTGKPEQDKEAWLAWLAAGMDARSELVHTDYLGYGAAFVTVWTAQNGQLAVTGDNPFSMSSSTDPATGQALSAVRTWNVKDTSHAVYFDLEKIVRWRANSANAPAGSGAWEVTETIDNPYAGTLPVVPFVRRSSLDDDTGTSAVADILDLTSAQSKLLEDAMVTSEYFARPRRWATGLEIVEDDDGEPIDPFGESRFLQSEDPETKFGQLSGSGLDSYSDLTATITQAIGALTGLPPGYLGLHGDQPPNAESVRASEAQLTSGSYSEQRQLAGPWGKVSALMWAAGDPTNRDPADRTITPTWDSPEIRTPAQAADAAVKLRDIGVPLRSLLINTLGYEPAEAAEILENRRAETIDSAGAALAKYLP